MDEAISALQRYGDRANIIAGGTDLLGKMKDAILPTYPEALIDIKNIAGLDFLKEERAFCGSERSRAWKTSGKSR